MLPDVTLIMTTCDTSTPVFESDCKKALSKLASFVAFVPITALKSAENDSAYFGAAATVAAVNRMNMESTISCENHHKPAGATVQPAPE